MDENFLEVNVIGPNDLSPIREEDEGSSSANQSLRQIHDEDEPSFFENSDQVENLNLSNTDCRSSLNTDEVFLSVTENMPATNEIELFYTASESSIRVNENSAKSYPTTPPEELRKQRAFLQWELQNKINELEELQDFTTLEKQINHDNCIPKDKVANMNDELVHLKEKVACLTKENLNYKKELASAIKDHKSQMKHGAPKSENVEQCSQNDSKELEVLRNAMITEIVGLDTEESKEDLMCSTSEELFNKLMQIIIRKEGEILASQKNGDADKLCVDSENEKLKNTVNSQKLWIQELENENERINKELFNLKDMNNEFKEKIKNLTSSWKRTTDEVSMLTTCNDILKTELNKLKELNIKETKHFTTYHSRFSEESNNLSLFTDSKSKFDDSSLKSSNAVFEMFPSSTETFSAWGNISKNNSSVSDCSSQFDPTDSSDSSAYEYNETVKNLNSIFYKEKLHFIKVLNSIDLEGNEITLTNCDSFVILKEIVEVVQDKLLFIQNLFTAKILKLQGEVDVNISELINIKNVIYSIYQDAMANKQLVRGFNDVRYGLSLSCGDLNRTAHEIDLIKDESFIINGISDRLERKLVSEGQFFVKDLSKQIAVVQSLIFHKDELIITLQETIEKESKLSKMRERKISEMKKEEVRLKEVIETNQKQLEDKKSEISRMQSAFIELDGGFLKEHTDVNKIIERVQAKLAIYDNMVDDCNFFSTQCNLMMDYIVNLGTELDHLNLVVINLQETIEKESKISEIRERKISKMEREEVLLKEIIVKKQNQLEDSKIQMSTIQSAIIELDDDLLKEHSDMSKTIERLQGKIATHDKMIDDCKFFSNQCNLMIDYIVNSDTECDHIYLLLSRKKNGTFVKMQPKDSTSHENLSTLSKIFSEYLCLQESKDNYSKELKSSQDKLLKTQEELKLLQKLNSNLEFEIKHSQDAYQNLRSELRVLRKECRNIDSKKLLNVKKDTKSIQTDYSSNVEKNIIAELKEALSKSNSRIISLEIQIQNENYPHLKKAQLFEVSLVQARDKIENLQRTLREQRQYNQELIQQIKALKTSPTKKNEVSFPGMF